MPPHHNFGYHPHHHHHHHQQQQQHHHQPSLLSLLSYSKNASKPNMPPSGGMAPGGAAGQPQQQPTSSMGQAPGGVQVTDPMMALRTMATQGAGSSVGNQTGQQGNAITIMPDGGGGVMPQQPGPQGGLTPLAMQQPRLLGSMMVSQQQPPLQMRGLTSMQLQKLRAQGPSVSVASQQTSPVPPQFQNQAPTQTPTSQLANQSPGTVNVSTQGPGSNQPAIASPAGGPLTSSQMAQSPAGYAPSPSSQIVPSPVGNFMGRTPGTVGAPSPGSTLNTPINIGATASPVGRSQNDDQAYLEKLKQLSKYIDPLRRMIAKIDKDEDRKKELSKMKNLLDILSDPNKRCPMETLLKCEQVLERLELKVKYAETMGGAVPGATSVARPPEQNFCQPLLDAITTHIKSPMFNHTLHRVFGPAITMLIGPSQRAPSPPPKRKKVFEEISEIPDILQGEIAHLDQRFKVQMDPVQHNGSRTVHLICQLDDKNLPCVPPISIVVPENYPNKPPQCKANKNQYDATQFLRNILTALDTHLNKMPEKYSVTSLLDTWEMSVRQACAVQEIKEG